MDFTRQQSLKLQLPKSVWVVGCGGVGYWTAYQLALAGVPELVLFDPDIVSDSNFNRIPYTTDDRGQSKAHVLHAHILTARPGATVVAYHGAFDPEIGDEAGEVPDWLIATTDTWASRKMCYEWCKKHGVKYLEASAEGEYGGIASSPAEFATPDEDHPGYASVPVWAGPCLSAGLLACAHVIHGVPMTADSVRMGWDGSKLDLHGR
jgi:sulfur-carrier protein adenylyltransferase/sulfurtransferase